VREVIAGSFDQVNAYIKKMIMHYIYWIFSYLPTPSGTATPKKNIIKCHTRGQHAHVLATKKPLYLSGLIKVI
jgi:hypothetical protein